MFRSNEAQLRAALVVLQRVAAGDFEARITGINASGTLGELLNSVNDVIDRCDAYVRESAACMDHVSRNLYFRKIIETGMQGAFLNASHTVNNALGTMQRRVDNFREVATNFENTVGAVVETVASAATELTASSETMQMIADDTSHQAGAVAGAADQASSNVQTVAAASEELTASINEISQQITGAASTASEAASVSSAAAARVTELKEAAEQIVNVTSLIADIAAQTNLLALNATIEAARAGEAGKGFAVVASEVKNLANQTAKATGEIEQYVANIQAASENTVNGITEVSRKVSAISQANSAVAAAVEEQTAATNEIARNIEQASAGTSEVSSNIQQVTAAAQETGTAATQVNGAARELTVQAESLRNVVGHFLSEVKKIA